MSVKVESFGFMPDGREAKLTTRFKSGQGFKYTEKEERKKHYTITLN